MVIGSLLLDLDSAVQDGFIGVSWPDSIWLAGAWLEKRERRRGSVLAKGPARWVSRGSRRRIVRNGYL